MRNRVGLFAVSLCLAAGLLAQTAPAPAPAPASAAAPAGPQIWQIDLVPTGQTFAATQPVLMKNGVYTFQSWPEHAPTHLKRERVAKIALRITGEASHATVYQIDLRPSGQAISRVEPVLKNGSWIYRSYRENTILSVREADVARIRALTGEDAYWATEHAKGETPIGPLAMQGGAVTIASPVAGSSQGGPTSTSSLGRAGINGAPAGNWTYQGTPGTADAWSPANATVSSPGGVPSMPAATDGGAPPAQPH